MLIANKYKQQYCDDMSEIQGRFVTCSSKSCTKK